MIKVYTISLLTICKIELPKYITSIVNIMFEEWTIALWGTRKDSIDETIEKLDQPCIHAGLFKHKSLKYKNVWGLNIVH